MRSYCAPVCEKLPCQLNSRFLSSGGGGMVPLRPPFLPNFSHLKILSFPRKRKENTHTHTHTHTHKPRMHTRTRTYIFKDSCSWINNLYWKLRLSNCTVDSFHWLLNYVWWVGGLNYLSLVRNQGRSVSSFPDDVTHCIICFYLSRRTLLLGNRIASQHGGSMWKFRSRVSHSALYKQTSVLLMWIKRQHLLSSVYRYSFQEEIELLEAIYIHELTVEGPEERWVCPDERGFLAR